MREKLKDDIELIPNCILGAYVAVGKLDKIFKQSANRNKIQAQITEIQNSLDVIARLWYTRHEIETDFDQVSNEDLRWMIPAAAELSRSQKIHLAKQYYSAKIKGQRIFNKSKLALLFSVNVKTIQRWLAESF